MSYKYVHNGIEYDGNSITIDMPDNVNEIEDKVNDLTKSEDFQEQMEDTKHIVDTYGYDLSPIKVVILAAIV